MTFLIVPSLPAASMPCRTTSTDRFASAQNRSCSSVRRSSWRAVSASARRLVPAERRPVVASRQPDPRVLAVTRSSARRSGRVAMARSSLGRVARSTGRMMRPYRIAHAQERSPMTVATGTKPHPIFLAGRWVESPDRLEVSNPADPANPAGATYNATAGAVRGGGRRRRRRVRGHPEAAGLRARPDPARDLGRHQGAPRGARPAHRARGRQADPRRAGRGRPRHADLPPRRRGGGADDGRAHPARPDARLEGPRRHHAPLPDRPDRRHLAVQLPAQPGRPQARAGHRQRQPDRAQAAVEGPAHDADRGRDRRSGGRARRARSASCP